MKATERNAIIAFVMTATATGGLYWLLTVHFGWGVPWWFFAIFFVAGTGGLYHQLNEAVAMEKMANKD